MLKKAFLFASAATLISLGIAASANAQENIKKSKVVTLGKNQIINEDYFAWGEKVVVSGTINGDAYVAGGNVIVDGTINGDLITAGGTVNILGKIANDVRTAGGQVVISGEIDGNLTTAGGSLELTDSAKIGGSLTSAGGSLTVFAPIGRGATIGAGTVTIADEIGGNVNAGVGDLTLMPSAKIGGNLTYWSDNDAQIQNGAQVSGSTTHNLPKERTDEKRAGETARFFAKVNIFLKTLSYLAALLVGFLIIRIGPNYAESVSQIITKKPFASLGVGFATAILLPIVALISLLTIVGIPLALISLALFVIELYVAKIFVSLAVGQKLMQNSGPVLQLTAGLLVIYILKAIPLVGWIVTVVVALGGLGAIIITKKNLYNSLKSKKLI